MENELVVDSEVSTGSGSERSRPAMQIVRVS